MQWNFTMAQFECDECGVFLDDDDLVNCPNCNAPIGTFQLIQKKDGCILEERTATLPKGGAEALTKNIMLSNDDVEAVFTYKESKPKYDKQHTYIDKIREFCSVISVLVFLLMPSSLFAQDSCNISKKEHFTQEQINSLRKRFKQAGLYTVKSNGNYYWYYLSENLSESANIISQKLKISVDTLYMLAESGFNDKQIENDKDKVIGGDNEWYEFEKKANDHFFTHPTMTWLELMEKTRQDQKGNYEIKSLSSYLLFYFAYDPNIVVKYKTKEELFLGSITFSDNLKTYNGDFDLKGFGFNGGAISGIANYQYKDASDGSRIFEGSFSFQNHDYDYAKGYFKNDKQVGRWTWDSYNHNNDDVSHSEINFNENGIPIAFDIYIGPRNKPKRSYLSGTFENGKLVSLSYKDNRIVKCDGKYNAEGKPIGDWHVEDGSHFIVMSFDDFGKLIKSGYRDDRTGDWINATSQYPYELYSYVIDRIKNGNFLRSTSF